MPPWQSVDEAAGQHVNKTEKPDLEAVVLHGPINDLAGPPILVEERGFSADRLKQLLAPGHDIFPHHRPVHESLRTKERNEWWSCRK